MSGESGRSSAGRGVTFCGVFWPLLAAAIWGGMYVVSRLVFTDVPPITLGLIRMGVGGLALLPFLRGVPVFRDRRLWVPSIALAATMMFQLWGTDLAGAAAGSVLTLTTPVFVALLAPLVLAETSSWIQKAGLLVALAGAVAIPGAAVGASWFGDLLLVLAALAYAVFSVFGAPMVRERGALDVTAAASLGAVPFLVPGTVVELVTGQPFHLHAASLLGILYLTVIATSLAGWAWYRGLERLPAVTAAVFFLAQPVVGVALSIAILHEPLTWHFAVGSVLVAFGMMMASGWRPAWTTKPA